MITVDVYESEATMLDAGNQWIIDKNPDLLTGWNCIPSGTSIQMSDGAEKNIEDISIGDEIVGMDESNSQTKDGVVLDTHQSVKTEYTVSTQQGCISSSDEHRFLTVGDDGNLRYEKLMNISEGDFIVQPKEHNVSEHVPELSELVDIEYQRFSDMDDVNEWRDSQEEGYCQDAAEMFDLSEGYLYHDSAWTPERIKEFDESLDCSTDYRQNGISLNREISTTEMYLAGLIASDGTLSKDSGIRFYNTEKELHSQFPGDNTLTEDKTGCYKQNVLDYARMHAFNSLGIPMGDKNEEGMNLSTVYQMPCEYIENFVAGLIDGDGTVSNGSINISAKSDTTSYWYSKLLSRLGVTTSTTQRGIYVHKSRTNFENLDGVLDKMALDRKSECVSENTTHDSVYEVIPEELSDLSDTNSGSYMRQNSTRDTYDNLQFVEVESIEEGDTVQMYDISTSTNSFIADGFAVHNSSRNDIGNGFDYPYWINRCENINVWSFTDLSPVNQVFTKNSGTPVIKGRVMFDMLQAYKKTQIHEKPSYALEAIAQDELGYGKEDIESLDEGWMYEPEEFMKYNIRDVGAVVDIESEKGVLDMYDHIQHVTGTPIGECADSNIGIIDILFLRQAYDNSYALPTSTEPDRDWYRGGKVYNPIPGKHENVVYPDLASLYPYLMWSLNVSPETIYESMDEVQEDGLREDDVYRAFIDTRDDSVKRTTSPKESEIYYAKPDVKEGFVRSVIDDLVSMKYEYKKDEYSDEKYSAVKRIVNSCFTPDTEVLTPDGIRNITDITSGDMVYSWNKETGEMEEKRVTETIEKPDYTGDIIHIQNNNIDLKVTPDHRMLVQRSQYSDEWETVDAGDLNEYTHYETPNRWTYDHANGIDKIDITRFIDTDSFIVRENSITAGNRHTSFDRFVDANAFIELLGWYITEGSCYISDMNEARGDRVSIAQYKNVNNASYDRIVDTIESLNAHASKSETCVELCGSVYSSVFTAIAGSGSENKRIPEFIFEECSRKQKELLFDVLMLGDGDSCNNRYTTKSTELRDDIIRLLWELGYKPTYTYDDGGENNSGVWRIMYTSDNTGKQSKQSFRMHRDASTETAENGVYCIQVEDNHTLVAGRNGKFTNIWNCYGVFGDSHSFGTGFRLYDWRLAETITLAGQNVLNFTSNSFIRYLHENGYEDAKRVGGDTDSVMSKIPSLDVTPEEIQNDYENMQTNEKPEMPFFQAAQYVNHKYDEYMSQKFWIDDSSMHKMEVEIESYADSLFFLRDMDANSRDKGVKKRYAQLITWDEGEVIENPSPAIKGFESIRSDAAPITARTQERVFDIILSEDNPKESVTDYLCDEWDSAKHGEIDISDIGIPSKINKSLDAYGGPDKNGNYSTPQPHIRGARYANTHIPNENISSGDKPVFYYVDRVGYPYPDVFVYDKNWDRSDTRNLTSDTVKELGSDMDAIAVNDVRNLPDEIKIDYEEMAIKTIRDPLEDIIETMGWEFEDVTSSTSQTGMAHFM
jgi:DNA polymerase I